MQLNSREALFKEIQAKRSFLCVGLDTDYAKLPTCCKEGRSVREAITVFNQAIVDATKGYTVAYKYNLAFYEAYGVAGMEALEDSIGYLRAVAPNCLVIADAKRGDIANTAEQYAVANFGVLGVDAVTLSPYMGRDAVVPFLAYKGKWSILLALTSNPSHADFETLPLASGKPLYQQVLETSKEWGSADQLMYVVGATRAHLLQEIREIVPQHFLLVPGVGSQGGSLEEVAQYGMNACCGLLVNSSRGILYAASDATFAEAAGAEAKRLQQAMEEQLRAHGLL